MGHPIHIIYTFEIYNIIHILIIVRRRRRSVCWLIIGEGKEVVQCTYIIIILYASVDVSIKGRFRAIPPLPAVSAGRICVYAYIHRILLYYYYITLLRSILRSRAICVYYCYSIVFKNRRKVKAEVRVNFASDLHRSASDHVSPLFCDDNNDDDDDDDDNFVSIINLQHRQDGRGRRQNGGDRIL